MLYVHVPLCVDILVLWRGNAGNVDSSPATVAVVVAVVVGDKQYTPVVVSCFAAHGRHTPTFFPSRNAVVGWLS